MRKWKSPLKLPILAFVCLFLSGCVTETQTARHSTAPNTEETRKPLLYGPDLVGKWQKQNMAMTQIVSGTVNGKQLSGRFELEIGTGRLAIAAFSHAGVPLFTVVVTPDGIDTRVVTSRAGSLPPQWMVSDIMLAQWPEQAVSEGLRAAGFDLVVDAHKRHVFDRQGKEVFLVEYLHGVDATPTLFAKKMRLSNRRLNYELTVQSVSASILE